MIVKGTKQLKSFKRGVNIYVPKKKIIQSISAPPSLPVATTNSFNWNGYTWIRSLNDDTTQGDTYFFFGGGDELYNVYNTYKRSDNIIETSLMRPFYNFGEGIPEQQVDLYADWTFNYITFSNLDGQWVKFSITYPCDLYDGWYLSVGSKIKTFIQQTDSTQIPPIIDGLPVTAP